MNILIINGPNLNLLGSRETNVYGDKNFETYLKELKIEHTEINFAYFQSNIEGELINCIQQESKKVDGIIINAGGYTHTSVAIGDAIGAVETPCVEVHISNVYARESYRHESRIAHRCVGVMSGFGLDVYRLAANYLVRHA